MGSSKTKRCNNSQIGGYRPYKRKLSSGTTNITICRKHSMSCISRANGNNFYKLLEIIGSEQNICLAYRNLKPIAEVKPLVQMVKQSRISKVYRTGK